MNKISGEVGFWEGLMTQGIGRYVGRKYFLLITALWIFTNGSCITKAQTGQRPYVAPEPVELGFVESATGSLHLEIGLGSYPQRASSQPARYYLAYDSNI